MMGETRTVENSTTKPSESACHPAFRRVLTSAPQNPRRRSTESSRSSCPLREPRVGGLPGCEPLGTASQGDLNSSPSPAWVAGRARERGLPGK